MNDDDWSRRRVLAATSLAAAGPGFVANAQVTAAPAVSPGAGIALPVSLRINGTGHRFDGLDPRVTLLDLLRERLDLIGTKKGCNEGACGACTVLVDGARQNACLVLAVQLDGAEITTAEGIAGPDGGPHPVQAAFIEHDAFQCGFCTPGQVVSAVACINEGHATDEATVREWMSGNLCRCSAYPQITAAVLDAAAKMRG